MLKKKNLILLFTFIIMLGLFPLNSQAATSGKELIYGDEGTITRAEWIHNLSVIFDMTVEEKDYPDLYYTDLTTETPYYDDIMMAVEFGVIDLKAGAEFQPNKKVDREFAAYTLNYCMGFMTENDIDYSFSDVELIEHLEAAQIAVDRGWFSLVNGKFEPTQNVTTTEIKTMCNDALKMLANMVIDENHDNTFTFTKDVVEVPETTAYEIDEEGIIYIYDIDVKIAKDDKFAIYQNGLPVVYEAQKVEKSDDFLKINAKKSEDGVETMDAQGIAQADLGMAVPIGDAVITYIEDESAGFASRLGGSVPVKAIKIDKTIKLSGDAKVDLNVTVSNIVVNYKINLGAGNKEVLLAAKGKLDATCTGSIVASDSVELMHIPVGGVGSLTLTAKISIGGSVSLVLSSNVECGMRYTTGDGFQLIRNFTAPNFSGISEIHMDTSYILRLGTEDIPLVNAEIYAQMGVRTEIKIVNNGDKTPKKCRSILQFFYASAGAKASVKYVGSWNKDVWCIDANNSPCKYVAHFEDDKYVPTCSIDPHGWYSSLWNSRYGIYGSYGFDAAGEIVPVYTYTVDDDGNATITGYTGRSAVLNIPSEVDGHTVVAIGTDAFKGRSDLQVVTMLDGVSSLGDYSFSNCVNLCQIIIPDSVMKIGRGAFEKTGLKQLKLPSNITDIGANILNGNTGVTIIKIPRSVKVMYNNIVGGCTGAFNNSNIQEVEFEEGLTTIPSYAFKGCKKLEKVKFSDSITVINEYAFKDCEKLEYITLPEDLTKIGVGVFEKTSLQQLELPSNISDIGANILNENTGVTKIKVPKSVKVMYNNIVGGCTGAFNNSNIQEVEFEKGLTTIPAYAMEGCKKLKKVNFPDSITVINEYAFKDCEKLEYIILPSDLAKIGVGVFEKTGLLQLELPSNISDIGANMLNGNTGVTKIKVPKSVKVMYNNIVGGCTGAFNNSNIQEVEFEKGLITIPSYSLKGCSKLEKVLLPDTITSIKENAFENCNMLETIKIPSAVIEIKAYSFKDTGLSSVSIPNGVKMLGEGLFLNCKNLQEIKLPNELTYIPASFFDTCIMLKNISLPAGVNKISKNAFSNSGLQNITCTDAMETISDFAFSGCKLLTNVKLNEGLQTIGNSAFEGCVALPTITLPNSLQSIGTATFKNCDELAEVKLGAGITVIPKECFYENSVLTSIILPQQVTAVNASAFKNCTELTEITMNRNIKTIDATAFSYPDKLTIYGIPGTYPETFADEQGIKFVELDKAATDIKLSESKYNIARGNSIRLSAEIIPEDSSDALVWSSTDETIATVDSTGTLKGVALGTTTIIAMAGDVIKTCEVTVYEKVTGVSLNKTTGQLNVGETLQLVSTVTPKNATNQKVTWSSSDETIATVDDTGLVTARAYGTVDITVTTEDENKTKVCKITINPIAVTGIGLDRKNLSIGVGASITLKATISPENATNKEVTWKSSQPAVATVKDGSVTGISKGTAIIIATTKDGNKVASCTVTVNEELSIRPVTLVANKLQSVYNTGEELDSSDITITVVYSDNSIREIPFTSCTSNIEDIDMDAVGDVTLTVNYTENKVTVSGDIVITLVEKADEGDIPPEDVELERIIVTKEKIVYHLEDTVNVDDIQVTAVYSDGSYRIMEPEEYVINVEQINTSETGEQDIVIHCKEDENIMGTVCIRVIDAIQEIEQAQLIKITAEKEKTSYVQGETITLDDLEVTAIYSDGSTFIINDYTTNIMSLNTAMDGEQILVVTYVDNGITQETSIKIIIVKKEEENGDTQDEGSSEETTQQGEGSSEETTQQGESSSEETTSQGGASSTSVTQKKLNKIKVKKTKTVYYVGDTISLDDLVVTAVYTDNSERVLQKGEYSCTYDADTSYGGYKWISISYEENGIKKTNGVDVYLKDRVSTVKPAKVTGLKVKTKGSRKISIFWKKTKNADLYSIQIATKKNFKSGKKTRTTMAKKYTWKGLKKGKIYYVRVRGYNSESNKYGNWSGVKKVKIK